MNGIIDEIGRRSTIELCATLNAFGQRRLTDWKQFRYGGGCKPATRIVVVVEKGHKRLCVYENAGKTHKKKGETQAQTEC